MSTFNFEFSGDVGLDVDQVWPDGDAPANPTVKDVIEVLRNGRIRSNVHEELLESWDLGKYLVVTLTGPGGSVDVPSWLERKP